MNFLQDLKTKRLYLDGAMGSLLQEKLEDIGSVPEALVLTEPTIIKAIYKEYLDAGANILSACTFGANGYKLKGTNYSQEAIIKASIRLAKEVGPDYVALDVGPLGALIGTLGELSFEEAYHYYAEMMQCGAKAGADVLLIETMTDVYEVKAAVLAAKENTTLPIIVSMTFEANGRTLTGSDPLTVVSILEGLGVDAIGINCSTGPDKMMPVIDELLRYATVPVVVQPNAGLPRVKNEKTCYDITSDEFAAYMAEIAQKGASVLGGCCGTRPEYIQKTIAQTKSIPMRQTSSLGEEHHLTLVSTGTKTLAVGQDICVIGESINPTTNPELKESLRKGEMGLLKKLALEQKNQGAHILDINLGLPDINEKEMMLKAVAAISALVDLPLQIDSSDPEVIEAVLRTYNGKPIINSVNGKAASMERILPLAKKYGACVLGLTMDEKGIPDSAEERFEIAKIIIDKAKALGIPKKNMLLDCLVLTASAQQALVGETLKTLEKIRRELQVPTVLGVSNISFGLPNRPLMNRTFLTMALTSGLNTPIMNPGDRDMMDAISAFRGLKSYDESCIGYVSKQKDRGAEDAPRTNANITLDLKTMVVEGMKEEAAEATQKLLETLAPLDIVNNHLIPGLDIVGEDFETGEAFLPNLIFAAETVQKSFEIIKNHLGAEAQLVKGRILLATVAGDVHDIGKNILKVILENYGYEVLDLGKDVSTETIVEVVKKEEILLVGLSALMTTTVKNMATTVKVLKAACPQTKVMVGGAVLNPEYAKEIGADYYGKDAKAGANIAQRIFKA